MFKTVHELTETIKCGMQTFVRMYMSILLMAENVIRTIFQINIMAILLLVALFFLLKELGVFDKLLETHPNRTQILNSRILSKF